MFKSLLNFLNPAKNEPTHDEQIAVVGLVVRRAVCDWFKLDQSNAFALNFDKCTMPNCYNISLNGEYVGGIELEYETIANRSGTKTNVTIRPL